jgi:hypothetical protein
LPAPLPDSVVWNEDVELAPLLRRSNFGQRELEGAERVEQYLGPFTYLDRLADVADDTAAPNVIRINALKQCVSLFVNVAAAGVFMFSDEIEWRVAGVMFVCALAGGLVGGRMASKIPAKYLRWLVVVLGVGLSIVYFAKVLRR